MNIFDLKSFEVQLNVSKKVDKNYLISEKVENLKTREQCEEVDEKDELRHFRSKFQIPLNAIYLMGNSLGLCPKDSHKGVDRVIKDEWTKHHIMSWNKCGWFQLTEQVGEKIGKIIGAESRETIMGDTTSVNIFKCLGSCISIQKLNNPERNVIVLERENFPSDLYIAQGLVNFLGSDKYQIRYFDADNQLEDVLDDDVAVVLLSHVNYRTGQLSDMNAITSVAHKHGALIIWDLCHSVGAVPINLSEAGVDFAVGCTYKYLNSGPGAPAFIYVNKKHQNVTWQPITGWYSHEAPFKMMKEYKPSSSITRFQVGCPPVLHMSIVDLSMDIFLAADMQAIRKKSLLLSDLFIKLMDEKCPALKLVTPFDHNQRGSHLSYQHEHAYGISNALRERDVYGDFRHPDILRLALTPLYTRFVDVFDVIDIICDVVNNGNFEIICFDGTVAT